MTKTTTYRTQREGIIEAMNNHMTVGQPYTKNELIKITEKFKYGTVTSVISYLKKMMLVSYDNEGNICRHKTISNSKVGQFIHSYVKKRSEQKALDAKDASDFSDREFEDIHSILKAGFTTDFVSRTFNMRKDKVEEAANCKTYEEYKNRFNPTVNTETLSVIKSRLENIKKTIDETVKMLA